MTEAQGLYIISIPGNYWKIGIAVDVHQRISQLQCGCPEMIEVVCFWDTEADGIPAHKMERELHRRLNTYRTCGEWFHAPVDIIYAAAKEVWAKFRHPDIYARWVRFTAHIRMKNVRPKLG